MIAEKKEDFESIITNARYCNLNKVIKQIMENGGLSKEQTFLLFSKYNEDRSNGVGEESIYRTILILAYDRFVSYILSKMNIYDEDCYSVGKIGLIRAVDTFDLSKEFMFMTYASQCIKNEVLMHLRKESNIGMFNGRIVSIDDSINENDEHFSLYEVIKDEDSEIARVADKSEIESVIKLFKHLTPSEQFCLMAYSGVYEKPMNQYEISIKLNVSQSYVSRKLASCFKKIKILAKPQNLSKEEEVFRYDLLHKSYKLLDKDAFINYVHVKQKDDDAYICPIVKKESSLIKREVKKTTLPHDSKKEEGFSVKRYLKNIPAEEIDRYEYMLRFLRPLEQACVAYRYGLWGKQLFTYKEIAKKINWDSEVLEPHYKRAIKKIKVLIKLPSEMTDDEKSQYKELTKEYYETLSKEKLKNFGKMGRNCSF